MKLSLRLKPESRQQQPLSYGSWLLRQFAAGRVVAGMPFVELERACSSTGSLLCGTLLAHAGEFRSPDPSFYEEAALIALRTADGFRTALADPAHSVLVWPWEHMGTRVAWLATKDGPSDETSVGQRLQGTAVAYALRHGEQLAQTAVTWNGVAAGVSAGVAGQRPDIATMGARMYRGFVAEQGPLAVR